MAANYESSQASTNYKEAFSLFDKRGNGRVSLDSLGDLLRACGQNPTLSEIRDLEKTVGGDCESQIPCLLSRLALPLPPPINRIVHPARLAFALQYPGEMPVSPTHYQFHEMKYMDWTNAICHSQSTSRPSSAF